MPPLWKLRTSCAAKRRFFHLLRIIPLILSVLCLLTGCFDSPVERPDYMTAPHSENPSPPTSASPKKRVALTFDDGPNHFDNRTKNTVDELAKYGFRATFFVVGNRISGGDALAYAVDHGCEIGIHGYTHEHYYDSCTDAVYQTELNNTANKIRQQLPNYDIRLMRPVGGKISQERLRNSPYSVILWNVDSLDYEHRYSKGDSDEVCAQKVNTIVENVMSTVSDGSIILMHDIYESTQDAVKVLLARLYAEGYEVVTVSELFEESLAPGTAYYRR